MKGFVWIEMDLYGLNELNTPFFTTNGAKKMANLRKETSHQRMNK
jgi:hypothetical protein